MNKTQIEWALNPDGTPGYTWNPITGCLNGCEYCYARRLANTRLRERYLANDNITNELFHGTRDDQEEQLMEALSNPFYPRFWEERVLGPWDQYARYRPKGIFVCDMSDLFGLGVPEKWTQDVLHTIRNSKGHRFYLLTKQPQNLIKWSPFPENCYVGVTATNAAQYTNAVDWLMEIEAKIKFMSFEPLLEYFPVLAIKGAEYMRWLDWIIIGAQTKPTVMPELEWVNEILSAANKASIPVFLKDNLKPLWGIPPLDDDVVLRQEMPK